MKLRLLVGLLSLSFISHVTATDEITKPPGKGVINGFLNIFRGNPTQIDKAGVLHTKYLKMTMELSPLPLKLSDTRQLKVTLLLTNKSKKVLHLEFPTTQRIEILIRDKTGKLVTQWSEDQSFSNIASYTLINPSERVEYSTSISTRDLVADGEYIVQGFFPNFEELSITKSIIPEK